MRLWGRCHSIVSTTKSKLWSCWLISTAQLDTLIIHSLKTIFNFQILRTTLFNDLSHSQEYIDTGHFHIHNLFNEYIYMISFWRRSFRVRCNKTLFYHHGSVYKNYKNEELNWVDIFLPKSISHLPWFASWFTFILWILWRLFLWLPNHIAWKGGLMKEE